ncbi:hypothetical protein [Peredibacter starrii]|uniref:Lipid/polyisoprenoid-binding YceI-like domain-containing protein n=1 Tax=Peredibacter starrii TaxID=28202 RepID=A0AAX4HV14_9BACT|nr:hypothetical protein [Peredibacter starrii]WPU67091.1 hypothetical protein SOO65_10030 [Peredibacter starrii]
MKFLIILLISNSLMASTEVEDAKRSIQELIRPLIAGASKTRPKGTEKFRVDGCDKTKINWMNVLTMKEEASVTYKFKDGCDIQGTIKPKVFQTFPASLDLRNIQSYSKVESQNKITAMLEAKPILNLEMRAGHLTGKNAKVKFEADYRVQLNPMNKNPVEKNLGGELRITEINGKKASIKQKILVQ